MKTLRPYQEEANVALSTCVEEGRPSGLIVLATGLGKTFLVARFVRQWIEQGGRRVLFLAHSVLIVTQARNEFRTTFPETRMGLVNGTTCEHIDAQIIFCTLQSVKNLNCTSDAFDLVIVDEAHHGEAVSYRDIITWFKPKFLVGMTATPRRRDGKDIRTIFGPPVFEYPLEKALADGRWLAHVNYQIRTDHFAGKKIKEYLQELGVTGRAVARSQIDSTLFLSERVEEIARQVKEAQAEGKQTLIFCNSVAHIRRVRPYFPEAEPFHSGMHAAALERVDAAFRSRALQTMISVNKLNEGADYPEVEVLVFLRSTCSEIVFLQQLGRGMRKTATKHSLTVLDFVGNSTRVEHLRGLVERIARERSVFHKLDRLHIEGIGLDFTFSEEARDVIKLVERMNVEPFETYDEASTAAKELNIKNPKEYKKRFRENPRLPKNPKRFYAAVWEERGGWGGFLGQTIRTRHEKGFYYPTIEEASTAAKLLRCFHIRHYIERRHKDPRLPSDPKTFYGQEAWKRLGACGWWKYLGCYEANMAYRPYQTVAEASQAAQRHGFRTPEEYKQRCKRADRKLESRPDIWYHSRGWEEIGGWDGFLGITNATTPGVKS